MNIIVMIYLSSHLDNNDCISIRNMKATMNPEEQHQEPPTDPAPQPTVEPAATEPVTSASAQGLNPPQKKSNKKLIIITSLIIAAIIGASVGYILFNMKKVAAPTTATTSQTIIPAKTNASVDAATKSLTDVPTSETTLTNIDDSSQGTDASTNAGTVGDSVDENNF